MSTQGTVFNIQRFTLHDGPGIRTEFFLKGCPLRCAWCGNPESFNRHIEIGVYQNKCISAEKCGSCRDVCPNNDMLIFKESKLNEVDRTQCNGCLTCSDECPSEAIKQWGQSVSVDDCMRVIKKDTGYYQRSGGGVTISGGEPLLQHRFVLELLERCKSENIHTCVESSFFVHWPRIESLLDVTDLFISDLKVIDSKKHKQYTGVSNKKILKNLIQLSKTGKPLILRIPVIPTINDDWDNISATADFILNELSDNAPTLQLLSFMRLGEDKYQSLGIDYPMKTLEFDRDSFQQRVTDIATYFNRRGVRCTVGTKTYAS